MLQYIYVVSTPLPSCMLNSSKNLQGKQSILQSVCSGRVTLTCVCSLCSGCCWGGPSPRTPGPGSCSTSPGPVEPGHAPGPQTATPPGGPSPGMSLTRNTHTAAQEVSGFRHWNILTLIWIWSTAAVSSGYKLYGWTNLLSRFSWLNGKMLERMNCMHTVNTFKSNSSCSWYTYEVRPMMDSTINMTTSRIVNWNYGLFSKLHSIIYY